MLQRSCRLNDSSEVKHIISRESRLTDRLVSPPPLHPAAGDPPQSQISVIQTPGFTTTSQNIPFRVGDIAFFLGSNLREPFPHHLPGSFDLQLHLTCVSIYSFVVSPSPVSIYVTRTAQGLSHSPSCVPSRVLSSVHTRHLHVVYLLLE